MSSSSGRRAGAEMIEAGERRAAVLRLVDGSVAGSVACEATAEIDLRSRVVETHPRTDRLASKSGEGTELGGEELARSLDVRARREDADLVSDERDRGAVDRAEELEARGDRATAGVE